MKRMALVIAAIGLATGAHAAEARLVEKDIAYQPQALEMPADGVLVIVNRDPFAHRTRIERLDARGRPEHVVVAAHTEAPGARFSVRLTPGVYRVRCLLHDGMEAQITVR